MNQLSHETSPYLLQHADNPVDWLPWNQAALALAREQDKPILLSIGYSACHWCHVMAHESFEDPETAALMNRLYINIKVDREERPDLDKIYQQAHSALTERAGGWPLTVFLNPHDRMPIFAGTYFPPEPRHGLPSFRQILQQIHDIYRNRRDDIEQQSRALQTFFERSSQPQPQRQTLTAMPLDVAASQIRQQFDARHGGFSAAPKFPHPSILDFILRHWQPQGPDSGDRQLLHTALFTLEKMCRGGIVDHLGGGFFRYSTDEQWMIPHFEKMLYDNGPLLALTAQAWRISGDTVFRDTAIATAEWVMREMQSTDGGYFSAQDADSEGEEGRFYVWDRSELQHHIEPQHWPLFEQHFCLDQGANFEGKWHLHICCDAKTLGERHHIPLTQVRQQLHDDCRKLLQLREQRPRPGLDDKILTAWNGLMIQGMARAGRLLQQPRYIESAKRATTFVHHMLWRDQRLFATTRNGNTRLNAYLDDYAFMLHALLELLQCEWQPQWLQWATELADVLLARFEDQHNGGFYFTSDDHEQLIVRSKTFADEAIASGNGIATLALQRLGWLTADSRYLQAAENALHAAASSIELNTIAHCTMLSALQEHLKPPDIVILRGQQDSLQSWNDAASDNYLTDTLIFSCPQHDNEPEWLAAKQPDGEAAAFICNGVSCREGINRMEDFQQWIEQKSSKIS